MSERAVVRLLIAVTIVASAVRLLAILGLHPLNWDEIEFFRATDWVRQGLVPYRDFWEHHTPLQWYLFAPFAAMTTTPGAAAIVWMRIAQVPLWMATFWFANVWMKRSGLGAVGRWTAIALACCSSLLMLAAVEYRVDVVGCAVYLAALVILSRPSAALRAGSDGEGSGWRPFFAGALLCLTGFANLRLGPLLALTVLLDAIIDRRDQRWRFNRRVIWVILGVTVTFALGLGYFAMRGALLPLYRHVWVENYLGDKYAERIPWAFVHRMLIPFGIRIYGAGNAFEWSGIDIAGAALIILGLIGLVRALGRAKRPDETFFFAVLQVANMLFIARMKFVYNYHLEIVVMLMLPFVAAEVGGATRVQRLVPAFAVLALVLSSVLVIFRGKENDFAYQDLIMREADSHTPPRSKVFDGVGWALRRKPAYQFWFLPDLIRQLVPHGDAPPYRVAEWIADPPAAVITDRNCAVWLAQNPQLAVHVVRHYLPLWRNLWLPGLSGITGQGDKPLVWSVPADGDYRVIASPALVAHPWFHHPLAYRVSGGTELRVDNPSAISNVIWYINNRPAAPLKGILKLRRRDVVTLVALTPERIAVFLVPGQEHVWFRQPPAGVTLDSEGARVTHVPDLGLLGSAPIPTSPTSP